MNDGKKGRNMKKGIKVIVAVMTVITAIGNCSIVKAEGVTKRKAVGKYVYMITLQTSDEITKKIPITATQTLHKKGTETTIGIEQSKSTSVSASIDLTCGWDWVCKMEASLGLTQTSSYTVSTSVQYTLKSNSSGKYRIEVWYPGKKEERIMRARLKTASKFGTAIKKVSSYTPRKNAQYKKLVRYE